jgi:hypothetical protein
MLCLEDMSQDTCVIHNDITSWNPNLYHVGYLTLLYQPKMLLWREKVVVGYTAIVVRVA